MWHCNICDTRSASVEQGEARSNVRKLGLTPFRLWRCPSCGSLHAKDPVDYADIYRDYPFHRVGKEDASGWLMQSGYRNLLRRLRRAGLEKQSRVLDYGCGGGEFLRYLRTQGYDVVGYDAYSTEFSDPSVLSRTYDFVLSQDVLEHVPEPWEHIEALAALVKPGGLVAIGTPMADAVDMVAPEKSFHMLHLPYHRHIFSKQALLGVGQRLGWELVAMHTKFYANTLVPGMNGEFFAHYAQTGDNTIDYVLEPLRFGLPQLYSPKGLFLALFGYFLVAEDNQMAVFRRPA